ncbi:yippee zinc-binding/DNA-binding /Mis18, centromere assembly-domain-containing protein [Massariosphaeria phaeospora]|uniref:Yippee zinc-binding/DNA-binding /Mis18, centromere assembly-domain-containing protein n=1 Tax=Massariosphaeria phaeospora TaxID=100035 RepID=A0A7C8MKW1_9PLEO|nr:yippee zinc-binding/DNA-binding /Mis18, centromere assembly-domain-containing protein [Massariosphaeria phaeospora]
MPLGVSPPISFPLYLFPPIPFLHRRRRSSAISTSTASTGTPSPNNSPPTHPTSFLPPSSTSHLHCCKCLADLIPTSSIVSKGFTGRHGRAYLVSPPTLLPPGDLPNTHTHKSVPRQLVTGAHTVSDISCRNCGSVLGWKYVGAEEESQRYKVGKFILETKRVVRGAGWEGYAEHTEDTGENGLRDEDVEFDSQDEDECEDLFSGIWSPALARRRRKTKGFAGMDG